MKVSLRPLLLTVVLALSAPIVALAADCQAPNPDAKGLFEILESARHEKVREVQTYLSAHTVAVDALNMSCETPMMAAIKNQEFGVFHYLFEAYNKPDVNMVPYGATESLYAYALNYGDSDLILFLKKAGGTMAGAGPSGMTDLMVAAEKTDRVVVIDALIRSGAEVNARTEFGSTALIYAAHSNTNPEIIRALVRAGAELNVVTNGYEAKSGKIHSGTALMNAVRSNPNTEVVRALIDAGAQVNAQAPDGDTALFYAVKSQEHFGRVELLLQAGANAQLTNSEGTVLMAAIEADRGVEFLGRLIRGGAPLNAANKHGMTALLMAVEKGTSLDTIRALISAGAQVDLSNNGTTALHIATKKNLGLEFVQTLLQAGAQPNVFDEGSLTPLIYAALNSADPLVIRALVGAGAQVNYGTVKHFLFQQEQTGITAVMAAAVHNKSGEIIRELIRVGANPNIATSPGSFAPLLAAAANNDSVDVIRALLEGGADPLATVDGNTALSVAKQTRKSPEIIELLEKAEHDHQQPQPNPQPQPQPQPRRGD